MSKKIKTVYEPLIRILKKIQLNENITQNIMGEYMGMDSSQMSRVMNGESGISIPQLAELAANLNMSMIDILTYPEKFVPIDQKEDEISAVLQIKLNRSQKEKVLKSVFDSSIIKLIE